MYMNLCHIDGRKCKYRPENKNCYRCDRGRSNIENLVDYANKLYEADSEPLSKEVHESILNGTFKRKK